MPILKRFKTPYPSVHYVIGTSVNGKKEKIKTEKLLTELKKKNQELNDAKKWEVKVTTTQEVLSGIRDGISKTHKELEGLMFNIRRIRKTCLTFYSRN